MCSDHMYLEKTKKTSVDMLYNATDLVDIWKFFSTLVCLDTETQKEIIKNHSNQLQKFCVCEFPFVFSEISLTDFPKQANFYFLAFLAEEEIEICHLKLIGDYNLEEVLIPEKITNVRELELAYFRNFSPLEKFVKHFSNLQSLDIHDNLSITDLLPFPSEMPELLYLAIYENPNLRSLKGLEFTSFPQLEVLHVCSNSSLNSLEGLPTKLPELIELVIQDNENLDTLKSSLKELSKLRRLEIIYNDKIVNLEGLPSSLLNLDKLIIQANRSLSTLQGFPKNTPNLRTLIIYDNPLLTSLNELPNNLNRLFTVIIQKNSSLRSFDFYKFKNTNELYVSEQSFLPAFEEELKNFCKKNNINYIHK
ncbi:MAG: hypothetical protein ACTSSG_09845 [Candidatus Heimdallarchaeaceae archaeon]